MSGGLPISIQPDIGLMAKWTGGGRRLFCFENKLNEAFAGAKSGKSVQGANDEEQNPGAEVRG